MPLLTEEQALERLSTTYFEDSTVEKVEISTESDYMTVHTDKFSCGLNGEYGVVPSPADILRVYTIGGFGTTIRGMDLNGSPVFFKTEEEMEEEHREWVAKREQEKKDLFEQKRSKLDANYRELPPIFRKRIRWFRKNNEDFRWEYEGYEMLVCTEAVKIAETLKNAELVKSFAKLSYNEQKELVDIEEGHSGNTFGMACRLAYHYLSDPEMVFFEHGAMVPLVGCEEYGCKHPRPGLEKFAKERGLEV